MIDEEISYWQPRVMRHHQETGEEEFAVHEVYFSQSRHVITYTEDPLSPREASVNMLKARLIKLLEQSENGVGLGDLRYIYHKEDIQLWLEYINEPPIDYE